MVIKLACGRRIKDAHSLFANILRVNFRANGSGSNISLRTGAAESLVWSPIVWNGEILKIYDRWKLQIIFNSGRCCTQFV